MPTRPQSYQNHTKVVPLFLAILFILIGNVGWAGYRLVQRLDADHAIGLLVAVALLLTAFFARSFALRVQDRVIRLEMRLRLREVLPAALLGQIDSLSKDQMIALRFASDAELPDLTARVLRDGITDRKAIKQLITQWEADHLRA